MCGIFGYIGPKNPVSVCLEGLRLLQYRGYDSSGIAGVHKNQLISRKRTGNLSSLETSLLELDHLAMQLENAISHTRWATHGEPSEENAHPQFDQEHRIAVVHNGIIENQAVLREKLQAHGVVFQSDTDTEVIAQLVAFHYEGDLLSAFKKTLSELKGFWAIALIHKDHADSILLSCKENPLAIGMSSSRLETYISSDVNAFHVPDLDVLFLENEEIASVSATGVQIFTFDSVTPVEKTPQKMSIENLSISKNGFEHFMLKEIFEQPNTLRQALHGRCIEEWGTASFSELTLSEQELKNVKQIILLACGTSWHAGCIAASWIEEKVQIPARAEIASEFRYKNPVVSEGTLVIAISQSGETFDTIAAVRELKARNARILAICNAPNSTLTRDADSTLFLRAGPEISVCSTKAFTGQLAVLALFTLLMARLRNMSIAEGREFLRDLQDLPDRIDWVLREKEQIRSLAKKYSHFDNFFFLGRHYMYPSSLEGALKLKEISYINAVGYPAGEMKHGPIALINPDLAVIGLCGNEKTLEKMLSNLMEVKARKGSLLAFATRGTKEIESIADDVLWIPKMSDEFSCFLYSVAAQLLAYYVALERGTEIDQPRNLAKSVTVE